MVTVQPTTFPVIRGHAIHVDDGMFVCLNDIWKAAGFSKNQKPTDWKELPMAGGLIIALLEQNSEKSGVSNYNPKSVIYSKSGKGGGTYADIRLALAYAEYLSPKLAIEVKEVFLRYKAADATLADDVLQRTSPEGHEWALRRALGRSVRNSYTHTLQAHGVTRGKDYAMCTNALYQGLFRKDAKQLKAEKGLGSGSLRDKMNLRELAFVMASEALSSERIEDQNCNGPTPCRVATTTSARFIRDAIEGDRRDRKQPQQNLF